MSIGPRDVTFEVTTCQFITRRKIFEKMFKTNSLPQRAPFCVSPNEFQQDIEAIYKDEEERNKLYYCLDDKPPQQLKFHQIEAFLKGSHNLEVDAQNLRNVLEKIERLKGEINEKIDNLKQTVHDSLNK